MDALERMLDAIAGTSERHKQEVKLIRAGKALGYKILTTTSYFAMDTALTDEQIVSVLKYVELVESGFDTFIEQIKKELT